jgi:hypothetical protein
VTIQCESCSTVHELDPPAWVVSSGRAFRFRCSACGHSQSVLPTGAIGAGRHAAKPKVPEVAPPALIETPPAPEPRVAANPAPPPPPPPDPEPAVEDADEVPTTTVRAAAAAAESDVYLKQNGQIYVVRDWDTLRRWITERRIDQNDLVSEGGVRWEPVGSRPELLSLFQDPRSTPRPAPVTTFPFSGDTPFGAPSNEVWTDEDTEGIPVGLPPLPTEDGAPSRASEPDEHGLQYEPTPEEVEPDPVAPDDPVEAAAESGSAELPDEDTDESPIPRAPPPPPPPAALAETGPFALGRVLKTTPNGRLAPNTVPPTDLRDAVDPEAPTRRQPVRAAVEVEETVESAITPVTGGSDFFDREWAQDTARKRSSARWVLLTIGALVTVTAIAAFLGLVVLPAVLGDDDDAPPAPAPVVEVAPPPAPVEAPAPAPVEAPAPAPAPVAPAPPEDESIGHLLEKGWDLADKDRKKAELLFRKAIELEPDNDEAHYGLGYVLLMQGKQELATAELCQARDAAQADIRQDVNGMIKTHDLHCR